MGDSDDEPSLRRKLVEESLVALKTKYEVGLFAGIDERDDAIDVPLAWELRRDILDAFDDLVRTVRCLEVRAPVPADGSDAVKSTDSRHHQRQ